VFILLLLLVIIEIILTFIVGVTHRPLYQKHPTIEYILKPNQKLMRFGNNYIINQYGMRSADFPKDYYSANKLRVMVFGDSIANGGTRLDQSEIATSILQRQLTAQGYNAYVGNVSAGSWGPENILEYIKIYGTFKADIAILVLSSHDAFDVPTFETLDQNSHPTTRPIFSLEFLFNKYVSKPTVELTKNKITKQKLEKIFKQKENKQLTELLTLLTSTVNKVVVVHHLSKNELITKTTTLASKIITSTCKRVVSNCIDTQDYYKKFNYKNSKFYFDNLHLASDGQAVLASLFVDNVMLN